MKIKLLKLLAPLVVLALLVPLGMVSAQGIPHLSVFFYGDASILKDGSLVPAPIGTNVSAHVEGIQVATNNITTAGQYYIDVPYQGDTAVTVVFKLDGVEVGQWTGIVNGWLYPQGVELDLSIVQSPTVTTSAATDVEETTATLNGVVSDDGGEGCQYRFEYDTDSGEPYAHNTGWTGNKTTGQSFSESITGLSEGTKYYFRAQARNSAGTANGSELTFLTKPAAPTSFNATTAGTTQIDLSWTKGSGAQKTKIQRKEGSYPADRNDGTQVYFGTGTSTSDTGLNQSTTYYYRAWSYVAGSEQWSDGYAEGYATTVTSYDITLYAGWNLISLPLIPEDSDITEVISAATLASGNINNVGMVYCYDSVAKTYLAYKPGVGGTLPTMEDGKGYWASIVNDDVLTITGTTTPAPPSPSPTYNVTEGWNLIGFKSTEAMANKVYLANLIDGSPNYSMLWGYNAEAQEYFLVYHPSLGEGGNMEPGYGYWLSATADGTIVPP